MGTQFRLGAFFLVWTERGEEMEFCFDSHPAILKRQRARQLVEGCRLSEATYNAIL